MSPMSPNRVSGGRSTWSWSSRIGHRATQEAAGRQAPDRTGHGAVDAGAERRDAAQLDVGRQAEGLTHLRQLFQMPVPQPDRLRDAVHATVGRSGRPIRRRCSARRRQRPPSATRSCRPSTSPSRACRPRRARTRQRGAAARRCTRTVRLRIAIRKGTAGRPRSQTISQRPPMRSIGMRTTTALLAAPQDEEAVVRPAGLARAEIAEARSIIDAIDEADRDIGLSVERALQRAELTLDGAGIPRGRRR